jgi:ribosomal protein S18 acetylase RimI-like enzyme
LREAIDAVCAEGRWMSTSQFEPTPVWTHALEKPNCPRHLLLVAEDENRIVGWCRLFPLSKCDGHASEAELGIGLLPEYRERGLGRTLVQQAIDWAAKTGVTHVALTVRVDNFRAIHLFEGCGLMVTDHGTDGWTKMICQPQSLRG